MRPPHQSVRVVTYNIHKCRGLDRRVRPDRIVDILGEINADIVALQEVLSIEGPSRGGRYGNVILTRFPIHIHRNYDITAMGREPRGCLRTDIQVNRNMLHVFNVHLGTALLEHRAQARRLFDERIVNHEELCGARIVLGDFNEWLRGPLSRTLRSQLEWADIRHHLRRSRTYPGVLPFLHLDHIYFDPALTLEHLHLHRKRKAVIASDHLPLVADFRIEASAPFAIGSR